MVSMGSSWLLLAGPILFPRSVLLHHYPKQASWSAGRRTLVPGGWELGLHGKQNKNQASII